MTIKDLFIILILIWFTHEIQIKKLISNDLKINEINSNDYLLFGTGALLSGSALLIENKELTPLEDILKLNKKNINSFDRNFMFEENLDFKLASDITVYTSLALPIIYSFFTDFTKEEFVNYNFKYAQLQLINAGITMWTKNLVTRYRPYTYDNNLEMKDRRKSDGRNSFFSGHTTMAFGAATYLAYSYELTNNSRLNKNLVWGGTLVLASSTGLFRILAGRHFLSDVLIGAVVGSGLGILIVENSMKNISLSNTSIQLENVQINYFTINFKI